MFFAMKIIGIVFKGIFLSVALISLSACNSDDTYIHASKKPIMEAVYASGIIQSQDELIIWSQAEGILAQQFVNEGEFVEKEDDLFVIKSERQAANLNNANRLYAMALKNVGKDSPVLSEAFQLLSQAKTKYEADSITYHRFKNLIETGATSQSNFDAANHAFLISKASFLKSSQAIIQLKDKLDTELTLALNQKKIAEEEQTNFVIKSTINGILYQSYKSKGEFVRRGEALAVLGSDSVFIAKLRVDEQDILRLRTGQKVLIKIDAYPGKIYHAVLSKIYAKIDPRDQSLQADAVILDSLPANFTGMAVEANIVIRDKVDAMVIPINYLLPGDSLLIFSSGGIKKVFVNKGISTLNEVEIINGINLDTKISKP